MRGEVNGFKLFRRELIQHLYSADWLCGASVYVFVLALQPLTALLRIHRDSRLFYPLVLA